MRALDEFVKASDGRLPNDLSQLQPYFEKPVDDAIIQQYKLLRTGNYKDVPPDQWVVGEKGVIDSKYDLSWHVGPNGYGPSHSSAEVVNWLQDLSPAVQAYTSANSGQTPTEVSQLEPYLTPCFIIC